MELDPIEEYCLTRIGYLVEKWWECDELFRAAKLARVFNHVPEQLRTYKKSSYDFHKNIECFLVKVYKEHSENFATLLNNFLTMRANEEITDTFYDCLPPLHLTLTPELEVKFSSLEAEKRRERRREIFVFLDKYPKIKASYKGALETFASSVPDSERHCLSSCRETVDGLLKSVGRTKNWEESLKKLFKNENDQNIIRTLRNALSWPGVHGYADRKDVEIKLLLVEDCIWWILSKSEKKEVELI